MLLLATGAATLVALVRKQPLHAAVAPAIGLAAAYVFISLTVFPMSDAFKSGRAFALDIRESTTESRAEGHAVLAFDIGNLTDQYAFYSDGVYFIKTDSEADLARHLDQSARVLAVVNADRLDELPDDLEQRLEVLATTRGSRRNVALIANYPIDRSPEAIARKTPR
jgi:hypothetical protein